MGYVAILKNICGQHTMREYINKEMFLHLLNKFGKERKISQKKSKNIKKCGWIYLNIRVKRYIIKKIDGRSKFYHKNKT